MHVRSRYRIALALVGLLLVLVAPEPGERMDDPGDASAEIAIVRAATHLVPGLSLDAPSLAPGVELAIAFGIEGAFEPAAPSHVPGVRSAPASSPLTARPPPAG